MTVISKPELSGPEFSGPDWAATAGRSNRRHWLHAGAWLIVIAAAMIAMFWDAAAGAVRVWRGSETFNHGFLIAPIVAYLLWDRRTVFSAIAPRPSPWLLALLPLPVLVWLVGEVGAVLELQEFAVVAMLQVVVAAIIGPAAYRALLFPCLYLFLLVPSGEWLTPPLQDLTAGFVVRGLELLSIPVYSDGVFLEIPNGRFEVAEACAGLRFLIANIAFGLLFANLVYRSWGRRIVFVALSFVIPIIANGFRALGIVLLAHWSDNRYAVGVDHIVYGWGFFTAILLLLIWIGLRFREDNRGFHIAAAGAEIQVAAARRFALVAVLALAVVGAGPAYARLLHAADETGPVVMREAPEARAPWRRVPWSTSWRPSYVGASAETAQAYSDGTSTVELFISVYAGQDQERKLIGFNNRLEDGDIWRRVEDDVDTRAIDGIDRSMLVRRLAGPEGRRSVWWTYWVDGHWTTSAAELRLRYVFGKLLHGHSLVSVLVLSAAEADHSTQDMVSAFLASLPPLGPAMGAGR